MTLTNLGDAAARAPEWSASTQRPELAAVEIRHGASNVSASLPMDERSAARLRKVQA